MSISIVIPNRYDDVIQPLLNSMRRYHVNDGIRTIIVADGHDRSYGFEMVKYTDPEFIFAKSANTGIRVCDPDDVLLVNDDIRFMHRYTVETFAKILDSDPTIGVLSPLIVGLVGNPLQMYYLRDKIWPIHPYIMYNMGGPLCFPCICLKREMLNQIGLFDESFLSFKKYGGEDVEMCVRAQKAGWKEAVTSMIMVKHGEGSRDMVRGKDWSLSFSRRDSENS
jgi:GT2 family glycosyltransferase